MNVFIKGNAMPKILENIKEKAISEARAEMLEEGYRTMTVRRVAGKLGIGVGTLYNYFPSKEYLAASVMLEDWQEEIRAVREEPKPESAEEMLRRLFVLVQTFTGRYQKTWIQYEEQGKSESMRHQYHSVLVGQLRAFIEAALPDTAEPWLASFLAELVLRFASDGHSGYEAIGEAACKLIKQE